MNYSYTAKIYIYIYTYIYKAFLRIFGNFKITDHKYRF